MNVNILLAEWSDLLIYSAIAVYAIAFIAYAFDLFGPGFVRAMDSEAGDRGAQSGEKTTAFGAARPRKSGARAAAGGAENGGTAGRDAGATALLDRGDAAAGDPEAPGRTGAEGSGTEGKTRALRRWARVGTSLAVIAALLHLAAIVARTAAVMRVPWSNLMEYALIASAFVVIGYLVLLFFRDARYLGTMVTGSVLLTLGLCITVFYTPAAGIIPALDNYWIWIHVPIAILSTVLLSLSAFLAALQILKAWREGRGEQAKTPRVLRFVSALPASVDLEKVSYRLAAVGFVTWTFTLVAGAFWAEIAWGRYWGWDAKEIWTFVVWVVYAAYLHARATRGWTATRVAVLNLIGIATIIFNATVVNTYFDGLHSYAGV